MGPGACLVIGLRSREPGVGLLLILISTLSAAIALSSLNSLTPTPSYPSRSSTVFTPIAHISSYCAYIATMAIDTPILTLNNGQKLPQVGFGLWKVDNATAADQVYNAIKTGYRLFDGACGTYH